MHVLNTTQLSVSYFHINLSFIRYDGGDCFTSVASQHINCTSDMLGDGICHGSCNIGRFSYDNGDCCDRQRTDTLYCRDPNHLER